MTTNSKRKTLAVAGVLGLIGLSLNSGTFSYLTDTDSAKNTFTIGDISIDQLERQQFNGDNRNLVSADLNKTLSPSNIEDEYSYDATIWVDDVLYNAFLDNESNTVADRIVTVKNTGENPAYVRTLIAYEDTDSISEKVHYTKADSITWNYKNSETNKKLAQLKDEDGTIYTVAEVLYPTALGKGKSTAPSMLQWFLDRNWTSGDTETVKGIYDFIVLSQAIQTNGFNTSREAIETGFGKLTSKNAEKWFKDAGFSTLTAYTAE